MVTILPLIRTHYLQSTCPGFVLYCLFSGGAYSHAVSPSWMESCVGDSSMMQSSEHLYLVLSHLKGVVHETLTIFHQIFGGFGKLGGNARLVRIGRHGSRDTGTHFTNFGQWGIQTSHLELLVRNLLGQGLGRDIHVVIGDTGRSGSHGTKANSGKDVCIVSFLTQE